MNRTRPDMCLSGYSTNLGRFSPLSRDRRVRVIKTMTTNSATGLPTFHRWDVTFPISNISFQRFFYVAYPFDYLTIITGQTRPRGFEKGVSNVHNEPRYSWMISEKYLQLNTIIWKKGSFQRMFGRVVRNTVVQVNVLFITFPSTITRKWKGRL